MPARTAVVVAAVLFGTTGTSQALGPEGASPWAVGAMRLVVGGTVLAIVGLAQGAHPRRREAAPARMSGGSFLLMALTGVCLAAYQPLFFLGVERNGVAIGTVVALGSAPVIAGVIEWGVIRRAPGRIWVAATLLALGGVALLAFAGGGTTATDPIGLAGSIGAGSAFAVFANAQRRLLNDGWDPFTVAGAMGAGSAVCSVLVLPLVDLSWVATPGGLAMSLWLGLATITLGYTLFTWGLQHLTAATAATLTLAEPLTAGILGIAVLGEPLAPLGIAGLCVLGAGLVLLAWDAGSPRDRQSSEVGG